MKSFKLFVEEKQKVLTFTFGRFNPPHLGHEKLLNAVFKAANGGDYAIYASHSQNPKNNPLSYEDKIKFMRKMFPRYARNILIAPDIKNVFHIADKAYTDGYTKLVMVVGSDRVDEFKKLLDKYNGQERADGAFYKFNDGIWIKSAGDRDPDADDVSGMSASKMRAAAQDNDLDLFRTGLPSGFGEFKELFNAVRNGMGLKELTNYRKHIELPKVSDIRERYTNHEIFNPGDFVMFEGKRVMVTERKPNFVICIDDMQQIHKCWLNQLTVIDDEFSPSKYYDDEMSNSTKQKRAAFFNKQSKKATDDPSAYKQAPGDAEAETKPSKYTKKYEKLYGKK